MRSILVAAVIAFASGGAGAHEFMVRPDSFTVVPGKALDFAVLSSHVFITSEEMEPAEQNAAGLFSNGHRTDAALRPEPKTLTYRGTVTAPAGTFLLSGKRAGQGWAVTPEGLKEGNRRTSGATDSFVMEKFAKTLVNLTPKDQGYATVTGDRCNRGITPGGCRVRRAVRGSG